MRKISVAVAMEPNPGLAQQYARKLSTLYRKFSRELRAAALEAYRMALRQGLVGDSAATSVNDAAPSAYMKFLLKQMAQSKIRMGKEAREVSYWYCRKMLFHITRIQKRYLENAGISKAILRQKWKVPVVRGQYMAPSTVKGLDDQIKWMTELITKMSERTCLRLQKTIKHNIEKGYSLSSLTNTLRGMENMDDARAKRVALDQSCKLTQYIQMNNAKDLGVKEAVWIHVPGQWTFRPVHKAMNNKHFDLNVGMWDEEEQMYVKPGELPFCRCTCRMVLPDDLLENPKHAK